MLRDFFFIHADVLRNSFVLVSFTGITIAITLLVSRWTYRRKAIAEASAYLKQSIAEARIREDEVRAVNAKQWKEIERLTKVQNTAVAAARSVSAEVSGVEHAREA
jgi:hypothetical protein